MPAGTLVPDRERYSIVGRTGGEVRRLMIKKAMLVTITSLAVIALLGGCSLFSTHSAGNGITHFLSSAKNVVRTRLSNGLQVVVVPTRLAPVATSILSYKTGSARETEGFVGAAHAVQRLLFAGGPAVRASQVTAVVRALGGDLSAETNGIRTSYIFTVPVDDLETALHLQALGMESMTENPKQWARARSSLASEIAADKSDPEYAIYRRLRADLFHGSIYAHDSLGTAAVLSRMKLGGLREFHRTWYVPNNAILVIAGKVDAKKVLSDVHSLFGSMKRRQLPSVRMPKPAPVSPVSVRLTSRLAYGAAAIALRFPGIDSVNYPEALVLAEIIRDGRGGLGSLRSSGVTFDSGFSYDPFLKSGIATAVGAFYPGQNGSTVKDRLKLALARYMNGGISKPVVRAAKLRTEMGLESKFDSVEGTALQWSQAVAAGKPSPQSIIQAVSEVTTVEVNRVARRYIDLGKADFATLTPANKAPTIPLSGAGYGGPEPIHLSGPSGGTLPHWAANALKGLPEPPSEKTSEVRLANGLRLIVVPEADSGVVDLYGDVKSIPFTEVPRGQEGVDEILGQLMSSGTSSMSATRFQSALDNIGADESGGTGFMLKVLRTHFSRGVQLLADNELHPSITTAEFHNAKDLIAQIVAAGERDPSILARRAFLNAVLPASDPALRHPTPTSVKGVTEADVKDYYRTVFRPDMTTIVVIGDTTVQDAKRVVSRYFGGWRDAGKKPNIVLPAGARSKASVVDVKDVGSRFDQVRLAELIPMVRSNRAYYALKLGNEVLAGGPYAGRLQSGLAARGLSYLSATLLSGRSRTFYFVDFAGTPTEVRTGVKVIRGDIVAIQQKPPSETEFDRARGALLRSMVLSQTSYRAIAKHLLGLSRLALPLDEPVRAAHVYARLTPSEVSAAMARWIRPQDFAEIVQGPKP